MGRVSGKPGLSRLFRGRPLLKVVLDGGRATDEDDLYFSEEKGAG